MTQKTEAQKRAQKAYISKAALIQLRTTPEIKEQIKAHAEAHGESVNSFIIRAIAEAMQRE